MILRILSHPSAPVLAILAMFGGFTLVMDRVLSAHYSPPSYWESVGASMMLGWPTFGVVAVVCFVIVEITRLIGAFKEVPFLTLWLWMSVLLTSTLFYLWAKVLSIPSSGPMWPL